jgi:F0F1-type ATP synthase assembly protein I
MRSVTLLSGVAVRLTTLAFGHLLHRYFASAPPAAIHDVSFLAGMIAGVVIGIFSFTGGCLLLRRGR